MVFWITVFSFLAVITFGVGYVGWGQTKSLTFRLMRQQESDEKPEFIDLVLGVPEAKRPEALKHAAIGATAGVLLGIAGGPGISVLLGLIGLVLAPRNIYAVRKDRFKQSFRKQLPRAVNLVVAYSTTSSLPDAFKAVSEDLPEPISGVFGYVYEGIRNSGYTAHEAVKKAGIEYDLPELKKFAENVRIVEELGAGEKAREVLESTAEHVRFAERFRLAVEANLCEIKNSALIADIAPVGIFLAMALFVPDSDHHYVLFHDRTLVYVGLGAIAAGWMYVRSATRKFRETI